WDRNQQSVLGQFSIGRVGQFSISANNPEPSQADRTLTQALKNALSMIGTQTLDHIVVGHEGCVSLAERGYL
ncbi:JAB domain-containing protein, partial [Pseudomonas lundensis]|uniref:JAB domain-containing protein n=1 Tax=Pseudomonas lundensis TaxID=86185 RepID=UPI0024C1C31F